MLSKLFYSIALLGLLTACTGTPDPGRDPVGRWVGSLVTDQGTCPVQRRSTLQINAHEVLFTPGDGSLVLRGEYHPESQKYHAELDMLDINHKPMTMVFDGYPVGQAIGGLYGTNACRAHITMIRM